MSFGVFGVLASAAAAPAQTRSADAARVLRDASNYERQALSNTLAADAAGIGKTGGDNTPSSERDADGRRLWEEPAPASDVPASILSEAEPNLRQAKNVTGESGNQLDLTV